MKLVLHHKTPSKRSHNSLLRQNYKARYTPTQNSLTNSTIDITMKLSIHKALVAMTTSLYLLTLPGTINAFAPGMASSRQAVTQSTALSVGYVPDGLTLEQYNQVKRQDKNNIGKDLGRLGPRGFQSRSMQAWQEAYEKGEASHNFAPLGFHQKFKQGKVQSKDIPYMLRPNGKWDNSDLFGVRRLKWSKKDREYAQGGFKREQSASILGSGPGFNWTGEQRDNSKNAKKLMPGFS